MNVAEFENLTNQQKQILLILSSIDATEIQLSDLLGMSLLSMNEQLVALAPWITKFENKIRLDIDAFTVETFRENCNASLVHKVHRLLFSEMKFSQPIEAATHLVRSDPHSQMILDQSQLLANAAEAYLSSSPQKAWDVIGLSFEKFGLINYLNMTQIRPDILRLSLVYCKLNAQKGNSKDIQKNLEFVFPFLELEDQAEFVEQLMESFKREQRYHEAVELGYNYINNLGYRLQATSTNRMISKSVLYLKLVSSFILLKRRYLSLAGTEASQLPVLSKRSDLAYARIIASLASACYMHPDPSLMLEISVSFLKQSLKKGFSEHSSYFVAGLAYTSLHFMPGKKKTLYNNASQLMTLTRKLEEAFTGSYKCRTDLVDYAFIKCWQEDNHKLTGMLRDTFIKGIKDQDYEFALYVNIIGSLQAFVRGESLEPLHNHILEGKKLAEETFQKSSALNILSLEKMCEFLRFNQYKDDFEDSIFGSEKNSLLVQSDSTAPFVYYMMESIYYLINNKHAKSLTALESAIKHRSGIIGQQIGLYVDYLYCLVLIKLDDNSSYSRLKLRKAMKSIVRWNEISGHWQHRIDLLNGMQLWRQGKKTEAEILFNQGLDYSVQNNYQLDVFFILSEMADVKLTSNADLDAFYLIKRSIQQLREWGAHGLADRIDQEHQGHINDKELLSQLQQTRAMLLHSEKMNSLGRMSGAFIHEVNNPLNGSMQALDFAYKRVEDPIAKESISDAQEGLQRISVIIKNLQSFAFSDRSKIEKSIVPICSPVEKALSIMRMQLKDIDINLEVGESRVNANETQLVQVFINLLNNSMHAINKNRGNAGLIHIKSDVYGDKITISVVDNAGGLSRPDKVFEAYYTGKGIEGVGLGLSITKQIIEDHDGTIEASNRDDGACFRITLNREVTIESVK